MSGVGDVRVADPNGTSIFDALSFKSKKAEDSKPVEEKNAPSMAKDNANIEKTESSANVKNVSFVEKNPPPNSLPLRNTETGELLKFVVDEKGLPILDANGAPQLDPVKGKPVFVKVNEKNEPIVDKEGNFTIVESVGSVPASNINFGDPSSKDLPPLMEIENPDAKKTETGKSSMFDLSLPLRNPETGDIQKFKVGKDGKPELDANGNLVPDEKGKPVYVKVNDKGEPVMDEKGQLQFVDSKGQKLPHSAEKALVTVYGKVAQKAVGKISQTLIKGVSVGVPFTGKAIGFGVKHAVRTAVESEVKAAISTGAKTGSKVAVKSLKDVTTVVKALETTEKVATEATLKTLTKSGQLGKGVETLAVKSFGKLYNPTTYTHAIAESAKEIPKAIAGKSAATVVKNTVVGATETALKKGVTEGIEAGVKTVIKKGGKELAETVTTKAVEKAITKTATTAATKAATTTGAKAGSKLAGAIPFIGAAVGVGVTAWDTKDAIEKQKDPSASTASKALAWTTVGLDAVSTVCVATGVGAPIGWIATGLSIGTSVASDLLR